MTTTALPVSLPAAAPAVMKSASAPGKTDTGAPETTFSAVLEGQLSEESDAAPEAGQAVTRETVKGEEAGQDPPIGGKELPPAPDKDASSADVSLALPVAGDVVNTLNPDGVSALVSSDEAVASAALPVTGIASPRKAPGLLPGIAADEGFGAPAEQDGTAFSATEIFKTAEKGANQSVAMLSPGSRGESNTVASSAASQAEACHASSGGKAAGSDDPLSAILDEIMPAVREASAAANGQGISSAVSATARENTAPAQQQVLPQPFTDLMTGLRAAPSHGASPAAAPPVVFNQPGWDQALGERVRWLVTQRFQAAEIHLDPPELGPVEVRLALDRDKASVQFISPHAAVREAIEAATPRLREMLGQGGIELIDVNVGQHSADRQSPLHPDFGAPRHALKAFAPGDRDGDEAILASMTSPISPRGLVDCYV